MTMWLIRHVETVANEQHHYLGWTDSPLTSRGQAAQTALLSRLAQEPLALVLSSDLQRARGLAVELAQRRGVPLVTDWRLREMHFGALEGLTYEEAVNSGGPAEQAWFDDMAEAPAPGGERAADVFRRVDDCLTGIVEPSGGAGVRRDVAVVSHGGPLRLWLAHAWLGDWRRHFEIEFERGTVVALPFCLRPELDNRDTGW
ncbi:MAG: histidine phosphatase family protein [Firmicutes bacterium]|nr:histidine phosphatase family protein [Bacillota bacterium]